nr:aminopeptidase P family protein [Desulfobacula sp.]
MTRYHRSMPEAEQQARISAFQKRLGNSRVDGALILQKADMFYYSGTAQQGWLYIPAQGRPLLMVFKDFDRAKAESGMEQVISLVSPKDIPAALAGFGCKTPKILGLELDVISANHYLLFQKIFP